MKLGNIVVVTVATLALMTINAAAQSHASQSRWMLEYTGKSENQFAMDKRLAPYLRSHLPAVKLPGWGLANADAMTFIGGVPGIFDIEDHRYVIASGCPAHGCVARGMLWVDIETNTAVFVVTANEKENPDRTTAQQYPIGTADLIVVSSANLSGDKLPDPLRHALVLWLHRVGVLRVAKVALLRSNGSVPVTTDQLGWTGRSAITLWE